MDFSWMAPAILTLLAVGAHQVMKAWWAKSIAKLVIFGLGITTVVTFFRGSNWGGIAALALLAVLWALVWFGRRRKSRRDKKSTDQHIYHHYP